MKKAKLLPILRTVFLIFVSLVLGINIYTWNAKSLTGNALPMPFGYGAAVVLSGSMEPAIMTDELIIVKAQDSYCLNDIVVFQTGRIMVVHRIVAMDGDTVTTQGDANNTTDAPLPVEQIKGKVIGHIPHVGKIARLIKTPWVTLLLILCALATMELPFRKQKNKNDEELARIKEEIRRLKEEQET